jgi:hypothetical protein
MHRIWLQNWLRALLFPLLHAPNMAAELAKGSVIGILLALLHAPNMGAELAKGSVICIVACTEYGCRTG